MPLTLARTPTALPDGTLIENFRIVRKLGRGGFGITYLATEFALRLPGQDKDVPMREVALKEFFPQVIATRTNSVTVHATLDVDGAEQAFRNGISAFIQESLAIAALEHQNIIPIHRAFEANGTAYFTMPYVRGESLRALIRREGRLSEARARQILLPILDGLAYAHAKGVLHRDLKPDNIILRENDQRPILIDFGTARVQAANDAAEHTRLTDFCAYTPGYAALEQYARAGGDNLHGPFTDVYGIAAVFYEAITGIQPNESAQRAAEVYGGRPDTLVPASIQLQNDTGYKRSFLKAIDWGLELASRDRPQTIAGFRDALDGKKVPPETTLKRVQTRPASGTSASARTASQARATKPDAEENDATKARNRMLVTAAAVMAVVIVVSSGLAYVLAHRHRSSGSDDGVLVLDAKAHIAKLPRGTVFRDCKDCMEMVVVPPGRFRMGADARDPERSDYEMPAHTVFIEYPLAVSRYPVTRGQWRHYIAESGADDGSCKMRDPKQNKWVSDNNLSWRNPGYVQADDHPVVCVNWNQAKEYARWMSSKTGHSYRLLSEVEYEYVLRAGTITRYPWGNAPNEACRHANVADESSRIQPGEDRTFNCDDGYAATAPVGSFPPNAFGLYDLSGNVFEWTADCDHESYSGAPADGSAWLSGDCERRIVRGGSWSDGPRRLRSAYRTSNVAAAELRTRGFRLARTD
jgi:formylglycine-generating enzyme required for sulfatase activity